MTTESPMRIQSGAMLAAILQLAVCCLALTGCGVLASSRTTAPSASAKSTTTELDEHGKPKRVTTREASSTGVGASATGDSVNQKTETESPTVTVDGIMASGGAAKSSNKGEGGTLTGASSPLLWVGIACLLFAAVAVWQGWKGIIIPAAGAGVVLLAVAFYPSLLLWAVLALVLVVGGPYIWQYVQGFRAKEALRAVVAGVADAPPEVQFTVQERVRSHATEADRATIKSVRKADGIVMASDVPAITAPGLEGG